MRRRPISAPEERPSLSVLPPDPPGQPPRSQPQAREVKASKSVKSISLAIGKGAKTLDRKDFASWAEVQAQVAKSREDRSATAPPDALAAQLRAARTGPRAEPPVERPRPKPREGWKAADKQKAKLAEARALGLAPATALPLSSAPAAASSPRRSRAAPSSPRRPRTADSEASETAGDPEVDAAVALEQRLAQLRERETRAPQYAPRIAWDVDEGAELRTEEAIRVVHAAQTRMSENAATAAAACEDLQAYLRRLERSENVELPAGFSEAVDFAVEVQAPVQDRSQALGGALPSFLEKYFLEEVAEKELPHKQLDAQVRGTLENPADSAEEDAVAALAEDEALKVAGLQRMVADVMALDAIIAERSAAAEATRASMAREIDALHAAAAAEREAGKAKREAFVQKLLALGNWKTHGARREDAWQQRVEDGKTGTGTKTPDSSLLGLPSDRSTRASSSRGGAASEALGDWSLWTSSAAPDTSMLAVEDVDQSVDAAEGPESPTSLAKSVAAPLAEARDAVRHDVETEDVLPEEAFDDGEKEIEFARQIAAGVFQLTGVDFERLQTVMEEGESGTNGFMPSEDERAALLSIDDQLAAIVPEREWEEKSITTARDRDGASTFTWGGPRSAAPSAPADPALLEQFEKRGTEARLRELDTRLHNLTTKTTSPADIGRQQLHALLMDASQAQVPMPVTEKMARALITDRPSLTRAAEVATAAQSDVDKMEQLLAGAEAELDATEAALYGAGAPTDARSDALDGDDDDAEGSASDDAEGSESDSAARDDGTDAAADDADSDDAGLPPPVEWFARARQLAAAMEEELAGLEMLRQEPLPDLEAVPALDDDDAYLDRLLDPEEDGVYEPLALDAPEILAAEQCANELSADIIDGELSDAALWEAYLKVAGVPDDHWRPGLDDDDDEDYSDVPPA